MLVKVHAQGFTLSDAVKDHTDSKLRLTLGIYFDKIQRADVYLGDINGPKGGEDKMCKIKITAFRQSPIVVHETHENLREAINACLHRVKRTLGRRFERAQSNRRSARVQLNELDYSDVPLGIQSIH